MGRIEEIAKLINNGQNLLEMQAAMQVTLHTILDYLRRACESLRERCVEGLEANEEQCRRWVRSSTATVTALMPALGYEKALTIAQAARERGLSIRDAALASGWVTAGEFDEWTSPEAVCRLGSPEAGRRNEP